MRRPRHLWARRLTKKKYRLRAKRGNTHFSPGPGEAEMEGYKFEDFIARLCLKTFNPLISKQIDR